MNETQFQKTRHENATYFSKICLIQFSFYTPLSEWLYSVILFNSIAFLCNSCFLNILFYMQNILLYSKIRSIKQKMLR